MRADMYKVIVERPRRGGGQEIAMPRDLEDSPRRESLRKRHRDRKWLNENLRPLERYLQAQIGRPWDNIFSEICAGIDRRDTVQQHIHLHIEDFVAIKVVEIEGVLHYVCRWGNPVPLTGKHGWGPRFYVDPRTGLLRLNTLTIRERRKRAEDYRRMRQAELSGFRDDRRIVAPLVQLHRVAGIWYRIDLAPIEESATLSGAIDALRNLPLAQCPRHTALKGVPSNEDLFGDPMRYARAKRQLSARELHFHGLRNNDT